METETFDKRDMQKSISTAVYNMLKGKEWSKQELREIWIEGIARGYLRSVGKD